MTRLLVVDDSAIVREAIAFIIDGEPDLTICGEAHTVNGALAQCEAMRPDVALIDISLCGEDGLTLVGRLRERWPSVRSVVLSLHDEPLYVERARDAGACGYVTKSESPDSMLARIRGVIDGLSSFAGPGE